MFLRILLEETGESANGTRHSKLANGWLESNPDKKEAGAMRRLSWTM
jgi:hypothetical protein